MYLQEKSRQMKQPELWGHLAARYQRNAPRKMLALDGGGIRGLITLQFLSKLESLLRQARHADDKFRLCDYFDYIGGTSTGAIIATCLARGMSVAEIQDFYVSTGNQMFEPAALLTRLKNFYNADPLKAKLKKTFGDANLMPDNLRCLLLVVTRNVTTDSAWPISSNPEARYNNLNRPDCNLKVPLWQLVRASTAAPIFFPPETVSWDDSDPTKTFVFVDGGVTPHNNPAFLLYRMATHPAYQLNWPQGERQLQLVSIGTGAARDPTAKTSFSLTTNLTNLPNALMYGIQVDQDINCRMVGRCSYGDLIDREVRDLTCRDLEEPCELKDWMAAPHKPLTTGLGRAFLYTRYNADLSREGLDALNLNDVDSQKIQKMDGVDQMDNLIRVGHANAESQVKLQHFGDFVNT